MTPELKQFLHDYARWAYVEGAPSSPVFTRYEGLCGNFRNWLVVRDMPETNLSARRHELRRMFSFRTYPFGGRDRYHQEAWEGRCHLNHERRAWVLEHLE